MDTVLMPASPLWWLTDWRPGWFGLGLSVLVAGAYGLLLARGRRHGVHWPWWRVTCFAVIGVGSLVYAVCGPLVVHRATIFWIGTLQVGVLSAVVPAGLAIGDPVGLARAVPGSAVRDLDRLSASWPVRVLTFPAVASGLSVGSIVVVFFTGYFDASTHSSLVAALLVLQLVGTGLLLVLPLLTEDVLPPWVTPPVAALVAFADGLLDAVPGIMLMVSSTVLAPGYPGFAGLTAAEAVWQQRWGGGVLLGVTEVVSIPVLAVIFVAWVRRDAREAQETDARLDQATVERTGTEAPAAGAGSERSRLWWEDDPRFSDRIYRR